jgi:hypothetical protein
MQSTTQLLASAVLLSAFGALGSLATGCATTGRLDTEDSTSGIRAAEEVGADDIPRASLHLQLAKEELQKAQALSKDGEPEQAESMLLRAEADAELAVVLSHEQAAKTEAEEAAEHVRAVRKANK